MDRLLPSDPVRVGPYRLVGRLGSGGMGQVYLGASAAGDRVAVKVIKPEFVVTEQVRERFAGEVEHLKMVFGARVARFEDADLAAEPPWLAVEYVPGKTVWQHIAEHGPVTAQLAGMLGAALAEGLERIHQQGILHRDLKPQNILLGPDGPKVIDFGLARLVDRDQQLTAPGVPVGTYAYMPPEQAIGEENLTPAADVYALGATLAYALRARPLYPARRVTALLRQITDPEEQPDLAGIPAEMVTPIAEMVAFDPGARPPLDQVKLRLLDVATEDGRKVAEVRRALVACTYAPPEDDSMSSALDEPSDDELSDDVRQAEGGGPAARATSVGDETNGRRLGGPSGQRVSVGWLVAELRTRYEHRAGL